MASEDEEFEFRLRLEQEAAAAARGPKPSNLSTGDQGKLGLAEAGASMATGALATPIAGLAGLVGAALPGPEGQGARFVEGTQQALTYQPRTDAGKVALNTIGYLPQKLSELADYAGGNVAEGSQSPALGAGVKAALEFAPALVSRGARPIAERGMHEVAKAQSRNAVSDATMAAAQAEGYVVPPTGMAGKVATSIGGKSATKFEASLRNQEVTNKIARREAGLREDEPISDHSLAQAREVMSEPYRQVAALSPVAKKALEDLKQARSDAKSWHRFYERSLDPKALTEARKFDAKADKYESIIDRVAAGSKKPELLDELKIARKNLAKNYEVENAMNVGTGNIDAAYLGRKLDNGAPLSGGLLTIGRFAQGPGRLVSRDASAVPVPGAEHLGAYGSALGAIEGGIHWGPAGAIVGGGIPLMRGPMRGIALSKMLQPGPTGPGIGLRLADIASRPAVTGAAALSPSLGLRTPQEEY